MKNKFIIILLFILTIQPVFSDQYKLIGNYVLLSVTSNDGRFLLYGRNSIKDVWTPLLFEDFPSTSYFKFYYKNGINIPFGEGGKNNFSETKIIGNNILYFWQNKDVRIDLNYHFTAINNETSANTLIIDMSIKNLTDKESVINYYLCIDTFLGERGHKHFILDDNTAINYEKEYKSNQIPKSIISFDNDLKYGINILINKDTVIPYRVFFANWKRIDNNIGFFKITDKQDFDLKPYSINDSACVLDYRDQKIASKSKSDYHFFININNNIKNIQKIVENKDNNQIAVQDATKNNKVARNNADLQTLNSKNSKILNMDLSEILKYLDSLNLKIKSDKPLTEEEIQMYNEMFEMLKRKTSGN